MTSLWSKPLQRLYYPLSKLVGRVKEFMRKYRDVWLIILTVLVMLFLTIVTELLKPANWLNADTKHMLITVVVVFGFIVAAFLIIRFVLQQVQKIDNQDREATKNDMKQAFKEALKEAKEETAVNAHNEDEWYRSDIL